MVVGLDNNVVNLLAREDPPSLRTALEAAVDRGQIIVPLTLPLALEVCGAVLGDHEHHQRMTSLIERLSRRSLLLPYPFRVDREVRLGHRLRRADVLFHPPITDDIFRSMRDKRFAENEWRVFDEGRKALVETERGALPASVQMMHDSGYDQNQIKAARQQLFQDPRAVVADWVRDGLCAAATRLGLKVERRPSPEVSPSLWYSTCYHVSKVRLLQLSQKGPKPGDVGDWGYAGEAAYLDVLVTDDRKFREIMDWAPVPPRKFIKIEDLRLLLEERSR
jgi:hypothetical protein